MALAHSFVYSKLKSQSSTIDNACLAGELEVVRKYISDRRNKDTVEGADKNIFLHLASIGGHVDLVQFLIEEGANVNAKTYEGLTALHLCSYNDDNEELAQLLISKQATMEAESDVGTPLSYACKFGRFKTVKCLLEENGADSESKDQFGKTPIDIAR